MRQLTTLPPRHRFERRTSARLHKQQLNHLLFSSLVVVAFVCTLARYHERYLEHAALSVCISTYMPSCFTVTWFLSHLRIHICIISLPSRQPVWLQRAVRFLWALKPVFNIAWSRSRKMHTASGQPVLEPQRRPSSSCATHSNTAGEPVPNSSRCASRSVMQPNDCSSHDPPELTWVPVMVRGIFQLQAFLLSAVLLISIMHPLTLTPRTKLNNCMLLCYYCI